MKRNSVGVSLAVFIGISLLCAHEAFADFSGQFAVTNWTISTQAFGCGASSVNTSGAPASVTLSTGTGCAAIGAGFTFPSAPSDGNVAFSYSYSVGFDGPSDYPASYAVNGVATQFSNSAGSNFQTGDVTFSVQKGQSFEFVFQAQNSGGQADSLTISNFTFTNTDFTVGCGSTRAADLVTAINAASATPGSSTVTLSPGCVYIESGDAAATAPDGSPTIFQPIGNSVTIIGNGATIERLGSSQPARFFYIPNGGVLTLNWLTLSGGVSQGANGGDATPTGDSSPAGGTYSGLGGAVFNAGTFTATYVTFSGNQAIGGNGGCSTNGATSGAGGAGIGGAVFSALNTISIANSTFVGNSATGGHNPGYDACSFVSGSAGGGGGGQGGNGAFYSGSGPTGAGSDGGYGGGGGGEMFLVGNSGGNGGFGGGAGSPSKSPGEFGSAAASGGFSGGTGAGLGGALFVEATSGATVINSTFFNNLAHGGDANYDGSSDGGQGVGGAVFAHNGALSLIADTLSGNLATGGDTSQSSNAQNGGNGVGGNIYVHSGATLNLEQSIVTGGMVVAGTSSNGNPGAATDPDVYGAITSLGYNLVTTREDSSGYVGSDLADGTAANLGELASNGGPTQTMVPLLGSAAIDAVPSVSCAETIDQRYDPRPFGGGCDIGSVEVNDIIFRDGFDGY